ncbi:hypothetical protein HO173_001141 [Letharia columbiana]|uniref:Rho-GAP domain-containing protein n=1 Tax=Letharia columbiana TaxID=112416 RepID=A0A8H6L9G4_9LECA|nr:uncharacterized protein HO173_001141 [Letharia columbiana]KAF6240473.1 hypothetical protein HO173_001141 [Letharia columbiana]
MAANNVPASAVAAPQQQIPFATQNAASPPSKRDLASWWKTFKKNARREEEKVQAPVGIFGVPLEVSIKYANVAISLTNEQGESYVYGYVPIVVAKCGVFLKEKATDVEGIFRLSGSERRIKELQVLFDSPDRYGKGLDWTGYTVHDAANILRRYLNRLPQPIVPLTFYERCRDPLRSHQAQAVGDMEAQAQDVGDFDHEGAITTYQRLITELPPLNRQLLLYILDLLAVFASKSELNRMTSANLAAIFQPGMLSHPSHDMEPPEYRLSQDVIIFLIENQDNFLVGMSGTAADDKTVKEVQGGVQRRPNTPTRLSQAGLGRSASNASAGADSLRKQGGVRRNVSVSSKNSRSSSNVPSPGSPAPGSPLAATTSGGGVQRSNTVPSKKSPAIPSARFRNAEPSTPTSTKLSPGAYILTSPRTLSPGSKLAPTTSETRSPSTPTQIAPNTHSPSSLNSVPEAKESNARKTSREKPPSTEKLSLRTAEHGGVNTTITSGTPNRERKNIFSKSPSSDNDRKDVRQPNKLRKKRVPELSPNASAQSSTHSLVHGAPESPSNQGFFTPMPTPGSSTQVASDSLSHVPPVIANTDATPPSGLPPRIGELDKLSAFHVSQPSSSRDVSPALKPSRSPAPSIHSRTSATEDSEVEHTDGGAAAGTKKKHRWRLSSTAKPSNGKAPATSGASRLGSSAVAEKSTSSLVSEGRPRKSTTVDSHQTQQTTDTEAAKSLGIQHSSNESTPSKDREIAKEKDSVDEKEKKGPFGWIKAKVAHAKEERKEREAEKERAKSPPRAGSEHAASKQSLGSLGAIAQEGLPVRGRSIEPIAAGTQEKEREATVAQ